MDLVTKKVSKALQVTPKYLALSVQGAVMHSFLSVNPWCKKSRIRETLNLSTDADRRSDTILERLRDLSKKSKN